MGAYFYFGIMEEFKMFKSKSLRNYFSRNEKILWCTSVILIVISFFIFDRVNYLTLAASLIGVTSLIFDAKGNPFGQLLMVIFSVLYGIISYSFSYYGEMATYLGMTAPMSIFALISWIKNPHNGNQSEVEIATLNKKDIAVMLFLTMIVTVIFFFLLRAFHTANLVPSTLSVMTSFLAVYLTYKRSAFFALAYAANDMILIVLWSLAALTDISYLSVITCFVLFFINDSYTYLNWTRIYKRQNTEKIC